MVLIRLGSGKRKLVMFLLQKKKMEELYSEREDSSVKLSFTKIVNWN